MDYEDSRERQYKNHQPAVQWARSCYDLTSRPVGHLSRRPVLASYSGPDGGLACIERHSKPFELKELDVDFIDEDLVDSSPTSSSKEETTSLDRKDSGFSGDPVADTFGLCVRENSAVLVLADGVNWGPKSRLASQCAVRGCMDYLNRCLYQEHGSRRMQNTQDIFVCLLRSFSAAHTLILQEEGELTTLCAAVVCPVRHSSQFVVCACNVGDSLAYVYSPTHGVREITQGSHDLTTSRDMRDALGALGPVEGPRPQLGNLTVSQTLVDPGDLILLCSDGVSDNLDPVVGRRARPSGSKGRLPSLAPMQRHQMALLQMEDLLQGAANAHQACDRLVNFASKLTARKRAVLEDPSLYTAGTDFTAEDQRLRRRSVAGRLATLPGKLDHASVVAYTVASSAARPSSRSHRRRQPRAAQVESCL
ncbi:hypothetical protein LAZ67_1001321 [Cordylochernes scorpioides]|uniref:PPM-type phosphatase domain-containing protein n=1 Tax=Cordylochernes scorpioides TaxID=51811 RepID=A0ABY6JXY3_9ARAC|nr:hypothetical protein LAZ67_1001321 [Cordylochernes scorpioides]